MEHIQIANRHHCGTRCPKASIRYIIRMLQYAFFLGGHDLEMLTIRELLEQHVTSDRIHDKNLRWGARVESYMDEVQSALDRHETPVLIELGGAEEWRRSHANQGLVVDHHDGRAGSDHPSSLRQIFDLLARPANEWRRWFELVDANDKGHVRTMLAVGATVDEMCEIRARDRAAQGVTLEEEEQAEFAAKHAQLLLGGQLTFVEIPHDRTSPVADALEAALGGPGFQNLLILGRTERHFFGRGTAVLHLKERFGGWSGGMLPERGFWGIDQPVEITALLDLLAPLLQ